MASALISSLADVIDIKSVLLYLALLAGGSIILNVIQQLVLPKDPSLPPVVFHLLPWIGSAVDYGMDPYAFFSKNQARYGDVFTFVMAGKRIIVCLTPAGSDMVLNGKLAHVSAEDAYTKLTTPVFGTEVVYDCPNHMLMQQKKFMKFGLSTENFKKYVGIIAKEVKEHLSENISAAIPASDKVSPPLDVVTTASQITICTASATLQGPEVRSMLNKTFAHLFHELDGGFTPLHWVFPWLPLPSYWKRDRANQKMTELYTAILNKRRQAGTLGDLETQSDMIQALAGQSYKDGTEVSDKHIAHMMIALLMAGQHTSSATTSWLLLHLGEQPDLQLACFLIIRVRQVFNAMLNHGNREKLFQEQAQLYRNADGTWRDLNYDQLQSPILNSCIRETLRMHPPIHSIMREVIESFPVPTKLSPSGKNYVAPKGYTVMASPGQSARDARFFERPEKFDISRWVAPSAEVEGTSSMEDFGFGVISTGANSPYLPFGAGRHRCIGEQFAYLQLATIIATFVRSFTWQLEGPGFPQEDYTTMLVGPKAPRNIIYKPRS